MKRRVGGIIPYWAVCLTVAVLLLMGVILGSVIGTFVSKHKKPLSSPQTVSPPLPRCPLSTRFPVLTYKQ